MKDVRDEVSMDAAAETLVVKGLERAPQVMVPEEFAARVMAALPAVRPARARMRVGRIATAAALVVLAVALFVLAPRATPSFTNVAFDVEMLLLVELAGIGWWFVARREV